MALTPAEPRCRPKGGAATIYGDTLRPHRVTQHTSASKSFVYDADGNMTRRGNQYLKYDSQNRLQCVGTSSGQCDISLYAYDGDGVQVADLGSHPRILFEDLFVWEADTNTGISTVYALGRSLGERHRTGASLRTAWLPPNWEPPVDPWLLGWLGALTALGLLGYFAWRSGALEVAVRRPLPVSLALLLGIQVCLPPEALAGGGGPVPARRWTYQDHLGNQVLYLNETPDVIYRRVFEPYGGVAAESTGAGSHERIFTSKREDVDTRAGGSGLINFGARWYDADIVRFLSVDPVVQALDDPQTHNPYGYVRNNPVTLIDPDGREWFRFLSGLGFMTMFIGLVTLNPMIIGLGASMVSTGMAAAGNGIAALVFGLIAAASSLGFPGSDPSGGGCFFGVTGFEASMGAPPGTLNAIAGAVKVGATAEGNVDDPDKPGQGSEAPKDVPRTSEGANVLLAGVLILARVPVPPVPPVLVALTIVYVGVALYEVGQYYLQESNEADDPPQPNGGEGNGEEADKPASEQEAREMGRRIGREIDRQAQRDFHDKKRPGEPDRTRDQLRQDAEDIFIERGLPIPDWIRGG